MSLFNLSNNSSLNEEESYSNSATYMLVFVIILAFVCCTYCIYNNFDINDMFSSSSGINILSLVCIIIALFFSCGSIYYISQLSNKEMQSYNLLKSINSNRLQKRLFERNLINIS